VSERVREWWISDRFGWGVSEKEGISNLGAILERDATRVGAILERDETRRDASAVRGFKIERKISESSQRYDGKLTGESGYRLPCNHDRSLDVIFNSDHLIV
jgi:hypothetical protein